MQTTLRCELIVHWSVTVVGPLRVRTQYKSLLPDPQILP